MKNLFFLSLIALPFICNSCKNRNSSRVDSIVPSAQESYIEFTTNPPGALVEIGVTIEGNNFKPGTGRHIGATPIKVILKDEDINDKAMVNFIMVRAGLTTIGQVKVDKPPVPGKIYTFNHRY